MLDTTKLLKISDMCNFCIIFYLKFKGTIYLLAVVRYFSINMQVSEKYRKSPKLFLYSFFTI